jgi:hypothetical protein
VPKPGGLRGVLDRITEAVTGVFGARAGETHDEVKPLGVSMDVRDVDPAADGLIPVEVYFQSNP